MKKSLLVALMAGATLSSCIKDYIGIPGHDDDANVSELTFEKIGTFTNGEGDEGFAEISAFDTKTNKLFIVNPPNEDEVSVWDISNPAMSVKLSGISLNGTPNSVAVHKGLLAVAVEDANKQANGSIVTYDTETLQVSIRILQVRFLIWLPSHRTEIISLPQTKGGSLMMIIRWIPKGRFPSST